MERKVYVFHYRGWDRGADFRKEYATAEEGWKETMENGWDVDEIEERTYAVVEHKPMKVREWTPDENELLHDFNTSRWHDMMFHGGLQKSTLIRYKELFEKIGSSLPEWALARLRDMEQANG